MARILRYAISEALGRSFREAFRRIRARKTLPFQRVTNRAKKATSRPKAAAKPEQAGDPEKVKSVKMEQGWDDSTTVVQKKLLKQAYETNGSSIGSRIPRESRDASQRNSRGNASLK